MNDTFISEGVSASTSAGEVVPGDLVAMGVAVYRILSDQGDRTLFVEAENIKTFERVPLTTAVVLTSSPIPAAAKKRHRSRDGR